MLLLATHPHEQAQLQAEVDAVFDALPDGHSLAYEDLARMPYLDMVLKESLRLLPSVPFIGRVRSSMLSPPPPPPLAHHQHATTTARPYTPPACDPGHGAGGGRGCI
jgi:hypothetical protein